MATPAEKTSPRQWINDLLVEFGTPPSKSELDRMAVKLMNRERDLADWAVRVALRRPKIHILKTWPEQFQAILDGTKTFEYRKDDRGFGVGDLLLLREFNPMMLGEFTGRETEVSVTYITQPPDFGVPEGYCVMSVEHAGNPKAR